MNDLVKNLRITAGMIVMCEKIHFGQDAALMEQAATEIEALRAQVSELREAAQPIVDSYWQWYEISEPDMTCDHDAKVHGLMTNLSKALETKL